MYNEFGYLTAFSDALTDHLYQQMARKN